MFELNANSTITTTTFPCVSVVVPVYNVIQYVEKCIRSILLQSYKNIEVVLIDDGSNDGSEIVCDRFAQEDNRVHVFHIKNSGVSAARNLGLEKSTGDFIFFVDSDDWIAKDAIAEMIDAVVKNDLDLIACNMYLVHKNEQGDYVAKKDIIWPDINEITFMNRVDAFYTIFSESAILANKIIKKVCIKNNKFNESIDYGEDMLFLIQCLKNIQKAAITPYYGYYYYYKRPGNVVSSVINPKAFRMIESAKIAYGELKEIGFTDLAVSRVCVCFSQLMDMIPSSAWHKNKQYISACRKLANSTSAKARLKFYFSKKVAGTTKLNYLLFRLSPSLWRLIRNKYLEKLSMTKQCN